MSKIEYPKYLYHESKEPVVVNSKDEHEELGKGWEETPAAFNKKSDAKSEKQKTNKDETETNTENQSAQKQIGTIEIPAVVIEEDEEENKKSKKNSKIRKIE